AVPVALACAKPKVDPRSYQARIETSRGTEPPLACCSAAQQGAPPRTVEGKGMDSTLIIGILGGIGLLIVAMFAMRRTAADRVTGLPSPGREILRGFVSLAGWYCLFIPFFF